MDAAEKILSLIPQRHPFVMVAELLYSDEQLTRTGLVVKDDNIFVERGKFSEAGLLENMAQTAAAGHASGTENKRVYIGYIGAVKNFEIFALPGVNDELITEVTIVQRIFDATIVTGNVWCGTNLIARGELRIFINKIS
jgi:predicted hotdog family 3-hydroxylacyl-ACP dehydratase